MIDTQRNRRWRRGLSLVDAIASLVILGAVTVPIATGIAAMARGSLENHRGAAVRCELVNEAERLYALPYDVVAVGLTTTSSELPGGAADLTVTVSLADYTGDLVPDDDFKMIVVALEDHAIHLFRSNWRQ